MRYLIKNGLVVNAANSQKADVLVENGKISAVGNDINPGNNTMVINAERMYLFPGAIDPHVHMHLKTAAGFSSDNFYTGSRAALLGGTTTLIDFVTPGKGEPLCEALRKRKEEAKTAVTDYSFHVSPVEWRDTIPFEIKECIEKEGITSFKVYMAYKESIGLDDDDLERVMHAVARAGGMVTIHCEEGDHIEALRNRFYDEGKREPKYHPLSRPPEAEASAVEKAIKMAGRTGCPLYIVHVSSALSLKHIAEARQRGQKVYAETCPQYLLLNDSVYDAPFEQSAPFVLSPPLRKKEDNRQLWDALKNDILQTTGTDHCPFTMEQKRLGIYDFRKIANGAGGVEHRLGLLYTYGVLQNRFDLNRLVAITATNAAKIFGLYPQKGIIRPGSDADIVIWNPDSKHTVSAKTHHMHCDTDIYEGFEIKGEAKYVFLRGELVVTDGRLHKERSNGKLLKREKICESTPRI